MAWLLLILTVFFLGWFLGVIVGGRFEPVSPSKYVRNYVGEELYTWTAESGLTKMRVYQQELLEWGKFYYITNDKESIGLSEEEFNKLIGQQRDLRGKRK